MEKWHSLQNVLIFPEPINICSVSPSPYCPVFSQNSKKELFQMSVFFCLQLWVLVTRFQLASQPSPPKGYKPFVYLFCVSLSIFLSIPQILSVLFTLKDESYSYYLIFHCHYFHLITADMFSQVCSWVSLHLEKSHTISPS